MGALHKRIMGFFRDGLPDRVGEVAVGIGVEVSKVL